MERSAIVPHLSWHGPQPGRDTDAYLLAMLLRIYAAGLDTDDSIERDSMMHPSVLTTKNMKLIAVMYAYYKERMEEANTRSVEDMLKIIKASTEDCVMTWAPENEKAIRAAEAELIEYVETPGHQGFSAFG